LNNKLKKGGVFMSQVIVRNQKVTPRQVSG
jgi:hypothetical protein